jgi:hypothetical protein
MFSRLPVEKLSSTRTFSPRFTSSSTMLEPMNPAPPVTKKEDGLTVLEDWRFGVPPPSLRDIRHSPDLRLPADVEFGLIGDPSLQVSLRASGGHGKCLDGLEALADFISTSWKM